MPGTLEIILFLALLGIVFGSMLILFKAYRKFTPGAVRRMTKMIFFMANTFFLVVAWEAYLTVFEIQLPALQRLLPSIALIVLFFFTSIEIAKLSDVFGFYSAPQKLKPVKTAAVKPVKKTAKKKK